MQFDFLYLYTSVLIITVRINNFYNILNTIRKLKQGISSVSVLQSSINLTMSISLITYMKQLCK